LKTKSEIIQTAKDVISAEFDAVKSLLSFVNESFAEAVDLIFRSEGRLIVTGIGKSAIIAEKIVATLNSTGTPAIFLHAADAIHGDLGIILPEDVVLCLSKSGNTPEIKVLVPYIKAFGNKLIALVSDTDSFLAQQADLVIASTVEREACPNNLAPTSSTTAQLVMGDALAVCLLECRSFDDKDFARFHPGGILGKKLYMRVHDLMSKNEKPQVERSANLSQVILEITAKRLGATVVTDTNGDIAGIITDGDLRRMLRNGIPAEHISAAEIMTATPKTVPHDLLAINAFELMKQLSITQLPVTDENGKKYLGMIHLHDILREGIV